MNRKLRNNISNTTEHAILTAIDLKPNSARAHYQFGYFYYTQYKIKSGLYEFERALGCNDEDGIHAWAQLYKATVYMIWDSLKRL